MTFCPDNTRLTQFLNHQLDDAESRDIELHVETCCLCADELERLTLSAGQALALPPIPLGNWSGCEQASDGDGKLPAIPGYAVCGVLGRGGQGIVYLAEDLRLQRRVAVKMIQAGQAANPRDRTRFRIDMEAHARLQHPNIIPIYEVGEHQDGPFFAMEYAAGGALEQRLGDGLLPPLDAARLVETLAQAMHYAHQRGVLHRDLKPGNVLLVAALPPRSPDCQSVAEQEQATCRHAAWSEGIVPKIGDFGLAKFLDADADQTRLTRSGEFLGTPSYMAPEQATGQRSEAGTLTDVYGLGAILYAVLTGHAPFEGATPQEIIIKVQSAQAQPIPPRRWRPQIPADLELICLKCLEKEPPRRYASAEQLADELGRFLAGKPLRHTRPVGRAERLWRWGRRNPAVAVAAGLAASLLVATTVVSLGWIVHAFRLNKDLQDALTRSELEELRARTQLAEHFFDSALLECERGEVGLGLLWMARSLETAPEQATELHGALRASLAAWHCRLFPLTGCHPGTRRILAFGPDGRSVWVGDADGSVSRRMLATDERVGPSLRPDVPVTAMASSRKGDLVLTAAGGVARLWEAATGKPGPTFRPPGVLVGIALSPDGQTVLTADQPRQQGPTSRSTIRRWDSRSGQPLPPTCQAEKQTTALALSGDGRTILAAQGGEICSWDARTGKSLGKLPVPWGEYPALACSPDGRGILAGRRDHTARLWDLETGRPLGPTLCHTAPIRVVAFSNDGRTVLTADTDRTTRTWAAGPGPSPAVVIAAGRTVRTAAFSPDGRMVVTGGFLDRNARIWNTEKGDLLHVLPHDTAVALVRFSPDGRTLATADWKHSARLWDPVTGRPRCEPLRHGGWVRDLAFSSSGVLLATASADGTARTWHAASGKPGVVLRHAQAVTAVAFDPSETRLVTGTTAGTAQVWDLATGKPRGKPFSHGKTVRVVAFSPEGDRVLTCSLDGTARLWDAATSLAVGSPMLHGGEVRAAAFSPDGGLIVTASWDATARLWDGRTARPRGQPLHHDRQVLAAAFSRNGRWVVTGSSDRTARLWDAATSRPLGPRLLHAGMVWAVASGAADRMILTGSEDGKARLWRMPDPVKGPVKRVSLWVEVLTGRELDAGGGSHVFDTTAWLERRQRLEELDGPHHAVHE
jgi:WD40 repeat protein/serine/threonine protein kinase